MAINRQDYQYIKSTIPNTITTPSNNSLQIGSKITNLVTELNSNNVFNVYYPTYYGNKTIENGWSVKSDAESDAVTSKQSIVLTSQNAILAEYVTVKWATIEEHSQLPERPGKVLYTHTFAFNLSYYITDANTNTQFWNCELEGMGLIQSESMNWTSGILTVTARTMNHTETLKVTIPTEKAWKQGYEIFIEDLELEDYDKNSQIVSVNVKGSSVTSFSWEGQKIMVTCFTPTKTDSTVEVEVSYNNFIYKDSVEKGILIHQVKLKKNAQYVLQVIDAVMPKNLEKIENTIKFSDNTEYSFNQHIFFQTPAESDTCILTIGGIGFAYRILGMSPDGVVDLRSIKTKNEAKVFLFECDKPWVVDQQGIIIGINDEPLKIPNSSSDTPLAPYFDTNDIKEIFSKTPQLKFETNENGFVLKILLPDFDGGSSWKHYPLWELTEESENCPSIFDNIRLMIYRDFLTETPRKYNDQDKVTRYGLVKILSKNNKSNSDNYLNIDLNSDNIYDGNDNIIIGIKHPTIEIDKDTTSYNFEFTKDEENKYEQYNSSTKTKYNFDLSLASLFGYNWKYSYDKNLLGGQSSLPYKYTSFCFAWGYGEGSTPTRLSDFSEPIIIDRQAITISKDTDGKIVLKSNDCEIKKTTIDSYCDTNILQIVKK